MTPELSYIRTKHEACENQPGNVSHYAKLLKRKAFFLLENKYLKDEDLISRFKSARSLNDYSGSSYDRIVSNMVKPFLEDLLYGKTFFSNNEKLSKKGAASIVFTGECPFIDFRREYTGYRRINSELSGLLNNRFRERKFDLDTWSLYRKNSIKLTYHYSHLGLVNGEARLTQIATDLDSFIRALNAKVKEVFPTQTRTRLEGISLPTTGQEARPQPVPAPAPAAIQRRDGFTTVTAADTMTTIERLRAAVAQTAAQE